mgnify:CR=1 FL=1
MRTEQPSNRIRVAAYIRVSTGKEIQQKSFITQMTHFQRLIRQNPDWQDAGIYFDYAVSGTGKEPRSGFERLLLHCRAGKIHRIVTKSVSRFSRNSAELLETLELLKRAKVSVFFENENLDTARPKDQFVIAVMGAAAEQEARSISDNIQWSVQKKFQGGSAFFRRIYGYEVRSLSDRDGRRRQEIVIREDEARIVRCIFQKAEQGMSCTEIARFLNESGVPEPESCRRFLNVRQRRLRAIASAEAENTETEKVDAESTETERVETESTEMESVEAGNTETENVEAGNTETENVQTGNTETENVEAENTETESADAERIETENADAGSTDAESTGWMMHHVFSVLSNERYTGDALCQKSYTEPGLWRRSRRNHGEKARYYIEDHHPAIISREQFMRIHGNREAAVGRTQKKYPLTRRILCPYCGCYYNRCTNTGKEAANVLWCCYSRLRQVNKKRCAAPKYRTAYLERAAAQMFYERFFSEISGISQDSESPETSEGAVHRLANYYQKEAFLNNFEEDRLYYWYRSQMERGKEENESRRRLEKLEQDWRRYAEDMEIHACALRWLRQAEKTERREGDQGYLMLSNEAMENFLAGWVSMVIPYAPDRIRVRWFDGRETERCFQEVEVERLGKGLMPNIR